MSEMVIRNILYHRCTFNHNALQSVFWKRKQKRCKLHFFCTIGSRSGFEATNGSGTNFIIKWQFGSGSGSDVFCFELKWKWKRVFFVYIGILFRKLKRKRKRQQDLPLPKRWLQYKHSSRNNRKVLMDYHFSSFNWLSYLCPIVKRVWFNTSAKNQHQFQRQRQKQALSASANACANTNTSYLKSRMDCTPILTMDTVSQNCTSIARNRRRA